MTEEELEEIPQIEFQCTGCQKEFKGRVIGEQQGIKEMSPESYSRSKLEDCDCFLLLICRHCANIYFNRLELIETGDMSNEKIKH